MLILSAIFVNGCSFVEDTLGVVTGAAEGIVETEPYSPPYPQPPEVFCSYFHYFKTDDFAQWWFPGRDPNTIIGPEPWRRQIWMGNSDDYPYIGVYDNVSDGEIMRWHIRLAKAAGIKAFLLYTYDWQEQYQETNLLFDVAAQEGFKIGLVEHHISILGAGPRSILDGRPQPILPSTYIGHGQIMKYYSEKFGFPSSEKTRYIRPLPRSLREVPIDALDQTVERISGMLNEWKSHPACLRIDGKPAIVIPHIDMDLTPAQFKTLIDRVKSGVGEDVYVIAIVPHVYMYSHLELVPKSKLSVEWAKTGVNAFTNWTPNGMATSSQNMRQKTAKFNVSDSLRWRKDPMIPIIPGFYDDAWRPGDDPAPTAPRHNGQVWSDQIDAALAAKPRFIYIQAWNEWHEGSQIEPSTHYSDPYLYLKILAQKLNKLWQTPPLPPQSSVDPLRLPYLSY